METNLTTQEQEELARTNYKKFLELAKYWNKTDPIYYSLYIAPLIEKYKNNADAGLSTVKSSRLAIIFAVAGFVIALGIAGVVFTLHDKTGSLNKSSSDLSSDSVLTIMYKITGTSRLVVVNIQDKTGGITEFSKVIPPWNKYIDVHPGSYLHITAQNEQNGGSLTAQIYINGKLYKESSSSGTYCTVTVSGVAK